MACASPGTPHLATYDPSKGYRFDRLAPSTTTPPNSDELFVVLAFSGGGTRAAALAYGVLAQLKAITLNATGRTLLDEVDVISSVSGGSFTSAYYALHGAEIFSAESAFHKSFLYYPIQRDLLSHSIYRPNNWPHLGSRVEIAAGLYADRVFGNVTFADLQTRPRPYVVLNATDASRGARFEFTQEQFDLICADLSQFPVARAVAASSAFPGLLNSMRIDSHNVTGCGYTGPGSGTAGADWVTLAMNDSFANYRRYNAARDVLAYRDPTRKHLHVLDGGLADNIGLRAPIQSLSSSDVQPTTDGKVGWNLLRLMNLGRVKTVVVITVNARTARKKGWDERRAGPGTFQVINASSGIPMGNFSTDTLDLLREYGIDAQLNASGQPVFQGFEVAFENLQDDEERTFMSGMGTNFELDEFEVNCLIDRGGTLLRESQSVTDGDATPFASFVRDVLGGSVVPAAVKHIPSCTQAVGKKAIRTRSHYMDIGLQYGWSMAQSSDVGDKRGLGLAFRVTKPNGWGVTVGYGSESFDMRSTLDGQPITFGSVSLGTLSGGAFYARRAGPLEASFGASIGYSLMSSVDFDHDAQDAYARAGVIGIAPESTRSWVFKPNISLWHNLTDRLAITASASYVVARPTIRSATGALQDRTLQAEAFRLATGFGFKIF